MSNPLTAVEGARPSGTILASATWPPLILLFEAGTRSTIELEGSLQYEDLVDLRYSFYARPK